MVSFPFMQVDAFTERPLAGNPCAVLFDTDELDGPTMQAIALENNLSETAFVLRSRTADFGVRYFTPCEEIPLAGHPTIATAHALAEAGRLTLTGNRTTVTFELKDGPIDVTLLAESGKVRRVVMTQRKPVFLAKYNPQEVMPVFGLVPEDLLPGAPIQTVSTGTPQLMIPLRNLDALRRASLKPSEYSALRARADFFSPHLFCLQGVTEAGRTFARHFGVPPDTPEDPFTGSATGGMAAYCWHHGLIESPRFVAEQGHWMNRPGTGYVEVAGARGDIQYVNIEGAAVTVIQGTFTL